MAFVVVATSQTLVIRRLLPGKRTQTLADALATSIAPDPLEDSLVAVGVDLLDVVSHQILPSSS